MGVWAVAVVLVAFTPSLEASPALLTQSPAGTTHMSACAGSLACVARCAPLSRVLAGAADPTTNLLTCLASTGASTPSPEFFMSIGLAYLEGQPESLMQQLPPDAALHQCLLNTTGFATANMTLNMTAVATALRTAFATPELGSAVASAVASCPAPSPGSTLLPFISCLRGVCASSAEARDPPRVPLPILLSPYLPAP